MTAKLPEGVDCSCYGCEIARQRAGISAPDRSAEPCAPAGACVREEPCWTHSEWVDEARCDPPNACVTHGRCQTHGGAVPRPVREE